MKTQQTGPQTAVTEKLPASEESDHFWSAADEGGSEALDNPESGPRYLPGDLSAPSGCFDLAVSKLIAAMLRVDHAGEAGAVAIYQAQQRSVAGDDPALSEQLGHMAGEEKEHYEAFCRLIAEHAARPTLLMPLWLALARILGGATAAMGDQAIHLCTVAVEDSIEKHYQQQIDALRALGGYETLVAAFVKFREEEIAHRDDGVMRDAYAAPFAPLLYTLITGLSKLAISTVKRV